MSTDAERERGFTTDDGLRFAALKGKLFEALLAASTLFGILALLVLFGYIANDAFRPMTGSLQWYLVYVTTLVAPTAAFTLYARRNPPVRAVNAMAFAVVFGGLLGALVNYAVLSAVSPYDVAIYAIGGGIPPLVVYAYARVTGDRTYTGPAYPATILLGLVVAAGLYGLVRPIAGSLPAWIVY